MSPTCIIPNATSNIRHNPFQNMTPLGDWDHHQHSEQSSITEKTQAAGKHHEHQTLVNYRRETKND